MASWTMKEALTEIVVRCESIAHEAMKTLRFTGRTTQMRYQWLLEQALRDPAADWTPEERRMLMDLVEPLDEEPRARRLEIRLTEAERASLDNLASEAGVSVSEYVRRQLFSPRA